MYKLEKDIDDYLCRRSDSIFEFYINLTISELIEKYNNIELGVIERLLATIEYYAQRQGWSSSEGTLRRGNSRVRIVVDFLANDRKLHIHLTDVLKKNSSEVEYFCKCDGSFGLISEVHLFTSDAGMFDIEKVCQILVKQISIEYNALETTFLTNAEELHKKLFDRLYSRMDLQLHYNNKTEFKGSYWFLIAYSSENSVFYFFDLDTVKKLIAHFKSNQRSLYSPVQLLIRLLTLPTPFDKSFGIESWKGKKIVRLPLFEAKYLDEALDLIEAEHILYDPHPLSALTICEKRGYYLVFSSPASIEDQVFPEILKIKDAIESLFTKSLEHYSFFVKVMNRITRSNIQGDLGNRISELLGSFSAGLIKGLGDN